MKQKLVEIRKKAIEQFENAKDLVLLEATRLNFLGKKGELTAILRGMGTLTPEEKQVIGQIANETREIIEKGIANRKAFLEQEELMEKIKNGERYDITVPVKNGLGSLHPITIVQREVEDIFKSMGFTVEEGFEVESEYNNFEAVNVPKHHPARDMQDTFWLENGQVLKTHTSAAQNRIMKKYGAPLKAIFPGRCFRNENIDASHDNTFFQIEGMMIDENISIANLIFFMKNMISEVFKKDLQVRLRPGFFPFVEPGFELDVSCMYCGGKGCKVCKQGGWIELCPCGMIHPKVLEMGGIDTNKYSGFAFGLGFSRLAMMKYGVNDIRLLNSGDLRFLKQIGIK